MFNHTRRLVMWSPPEHRDELARVIEAEGVPCCLLQITVPVHVLVIYPSGLDPSHDT